MAGEWHLRPRNPNNPVVFFGACSDLLQHATLQHRMSAAQNATSLAFRVMPSAVAAELTKPRATLHR